LIVIDLVQEVLAGQFLKLLDVNDWNFVVKEVFLVAREDVTQELESAVSLRR
jgi:hypothetical protein